MAEEYPRDQLEFEAWFDTEIRIHHLDHYLDEFSFRFNRRKSCSCGMLFYRLA